jgi:hypothetical protein
VKQECTNIRRVVKVALGNAGTAVGELTCVKQGARENTSFAYDRVIFHSVRQRR